MWVRFLAKTDQMSARTGIFLRTVLWHMNLEGAVAKRRGQHVSGRGSRDSLAEDLIQLSA